VSAERADQFVTERLSITDFLTDGSLARLCAAASGVLGAPVMLFDADDREVVGLDAGGWEVVDPTRESRERRGAAVDAGAAFETPVTVSGQRIAMLSMIEPPDDERAPYVQRFLELLAGTVAEVCEREAEQRRRVEELQTLYRLSSMLVGVGEAEAMLRSGLRSALETLDADVGCVRLIDEQTGSLRAIMSLDLDAPETDDDDVEGPEEGGGAAPAAPRLVLPTEEALDEQAMDGVVVASIAGDHAPLARRLGDAGFASSVTAGLAFRGRPLGVIDLYARRREGFSDAERGLLQSICQQLAAGVANARLLEAQAEGRRISEQVKLAADVQKRMLPARRLDHARLDLAARFTPCFELGGDFYDAFEIDGSLGLVIGDVVGKGVAAALLMAHVRATLRAHARDISTLDEIVARTNQAMCRDTLENEFATAFFGMIDPESLRLTYVNAGHEWPFVVHAGHGEPVQPADVARLATGGMALGVDERQRYELGTISLQPGDVLFSFTDGLTEAMSFDHEKFGSRRVQEALLDALATNPHATAKGVAQHVHWSMRRFAGLNRRLDDITILVVRVRPDGSLEAERSGG
jgi:sigma-B regulation protein RsbU (phosphoserine phosphatase)